MPEALKAPEPGRFIRAVTHNTCRPSPDKRKLRSSARDEPEQGAARMEGRVEDGEKSQGVGKWPCSRSPSWLICGAKPQNDLIEGV